MLSISRFTRSRSLVETGKRLVISDGNDNSSRYSEAEIVDVVRESEVFIYGIEVFSGFIRATAGLTFSRGSLSKPASVSSTLI
jgi:hypothetical protein